MEGWRGILDTNVSEIKLVFCIFLGVCPFLQQVNFTCKDLQPTYLGHRFCFCNRDVPINRAKIMSPLSVFK